MTSCSKDIKRIKQLEKECADLRRELNHLESERLQQARIDESNLRKLKEANEELLEFKDKARLENHSKSDFLANMSHEIRTPLNIILAMANLLAETSLDTDQGKYLSSLRITGRQLLEILNNILEFSRIEAGKISFEPEPFSLQKIINQLEASALPLCLQKNLDFQVIHDPLLVMERIGDSVKIFQILLNLINNAVKFTKTGSVTLELEEDYQDPGKLFLRVKDSGIGIDNRQKAAIFERFTRGSSRFSEEHRGAGLGLAISQRLAEAMGGSLWVASEVGVGSTFTCYLKLPTVDPERRRLIRLGASMILPKNFPEMKILLVDDIKENLTVTKLYLKDYPVTISTAENGAEALKKYRANTFDAILMDVRMPVMDGITATAKIREMENPKKPETILAVTAHAFQEQKTRFLNAGFNGVLTKPYGRKELVQHLFRFAAKGKTNLTPETMGNKALGFCLEHDQADHLPPSLQEILPDLFSTISRDLQAIRQAMQADDVTVVSEKAHGIKGVAGMYGFHRLASLVADLSSTAKTGNLAITEELLVAIESYLETLVRPTADRFAEEEGQPQPNPHKAA